MGLDVYLDALRQVTVYDSHITHNLSRMAEEAGIYHHLWRPEEIGIYKAEQLVEPLERALSFLTTDRTRFEQFGTPNGWGNYNDFVQFVTRYLNACKTNPDADVRVSR